MEVASTSLQDTTLQVATQEQEIREEKGWYQEGGAMTLFA